MQLRVCDSVDHALLIIILKLLDSLKTSKLVISTFR
jgi:hypothetical protein